MADEETAAAAEPAPSPRKKGRMPTFDDLANHHADMQAAHAQHLADADERLARHEAVMTTQTDSQNALLGAMQDQVATFGKLATTLEALVAGRHPPATAEETASPAPGEGPDKTESTGGEATETDDAARLESGRAATTGRQAAGDTTDSDDAGSSTTPPATAGEAADGDAAGDEASGTTASAAGNTADANDAPRAETGATREDEASGEAAESKALAIDRADEEATPEETAATDDTAAGDANHGETAQEDAGGSGTQAGGETAGHGEAEDAGTTEPTAAPAVEEIIAALAENLPLAELDARLEGFAASFAALQEAASQEAARSQEAREKTLRQIMDVLSALRDDLQRQGTLVQALHRTPQPEPSGEAPESLLRLEALQHHKDVVGRFDGLITSLGNMLNIRAKEEKDEDGSKPEAKAPGQPRLPPTDLDAVRTATTDLSKQLRAERRSFTRFAWIAAAAAAMAIPLALALGIMAQHEYTLVPPDDPTRGWKDRVWSEIGAEAARCISREDNGAGECVITVTPPAE